MSDDEQLREVRVSKVTLPIPPNNMPLCRASSSFEPPTMAGISHRPDCPLQIGIVWRVHLRLVDLFVCFEIHGSGVSRL